MWRSLCTTTDETSRRWRRTRTRWIAPTPRCCRCRSACSKVRPLRPCSLNSHGLVLTCTSSRSPSLPPSSFVSPARRPGHAARLALVSHLAPARLVVAGGRGARAALVAARRHGRGARPHRVEPAARERPARPVYAARQGDGQHGPHRRPHRAPRHPHPHLQGVSESFLVVPVVASPFLPMSTLVAVPCLVCHTTQRNPIFPRLQEERAQRMKPAPRRASACAALSGWPFASSSLSLVDSSCRTSASGVRWWPRAASATQVERGERGLEAAARATRRRRRARSLVSQAATARTRPTRRLRVARTRPASRPRPRIARRASPSSLTSPEQHRHRRQASSALRPRRRARLAPLYYRLGEPSTLPPPPLEPLAAFLRVWSHLSFELVRGRSDSSARAVWERAWARADWRVPRHLNGSRAASRGRWACSRRGRAPPPR